MKTFRSVSGAIKALRDDPEAKCISVEGEDGNEVHIVGRMRSFDQIERCQLTDDGMGLSVTGHITVSRLVGNLNTRNTPREE